MKKTLSGVLVLGFLFTGTSFADHHEEMVETTSVEVKEMDIVETAIATDALSTLVTAVVAADLGETLSSAGPFTVFAPVNDAFASLPAGVLDSLLLEENKAALADILTYHVVAGEFTASDLSDGMMIETVFGDSLKVSIEGGKVYINNAMVAMADVATTNGVVHVIDTVLLPSQSAEELIKEAFSVRTMLEAEKEMRVDNVVKKYVALTTELSNFKKMELDKRFVGLIDKALMKAGISEDMANMLTLLKLEVQARAANETLTAHTTGDIVDIAISSPDHTTLVTAVSAAGLVDTLKSEGPFTVFAPVNSAFAALPEGTVDSLLMEENIDDLTNILTYHVASGAYFPSDITDGLELSMVNGDTITFSVSDDGTVMINNSATITTVNLVGTNGVIHVIDGVLLP